MTDPALTPAAPAAVPTDPLVARLRADAAASVGGGAALLGGGAGLTLAAAWVVVFWVWLWFGLPGFGLAVWAVILAVGLGGAGVLWARRRGGLLADGAFEYTDPRQEWAGVGRYGGATAPLAMALDGALIGPRMAVSGFDQTRGREPASRERFFDRCALLLRQLAKAGEAVPLAHVRVGEDETPEKLRPVLNYLDRAGWIGASSDRRRLWLSTRAQTDLRRLGVIPPVE